MSAEIESACYPPTEGATPVISEADIEMVIAPDSQGAKTLRNVQTQHGNSQTVDAENIFLIPRCLWPESALSSQATTSAAASSGTEDEVQVVWIEPFANEVSAS